MPQSFNCPNCSAPLTYDGESATIVCQYCHTSVIVPEELRPESTRAGSTTSANLPKDLQANWAEIERLAHAGQKIEAIKLMRETFEIGLKDAKDAVEAIQNGQIVQMSNFQVISTRTPASVMDAETTERIRVLLQEGNKLQAIKLYREVMGNGLKEASDAIDAMEIGFKTLDWVEGQNPQTPILTTIDSSTATKVAAGTTAAVGCSGIGMAIFIILVTVVPILIAMASTGGPLNEPWARINPFGHARLVTSFGGEGTGSGLFQDPRYVATDNNGHIFVGEYDTGRIQIFDMKGKFIGQWTPVNEEDYDFYMRGMSVDRSGMMYLSGQGNLFVYNAMSGELLGKFPPPVEYASFDDVLVGPDSSLYATETWSGDNILHYNRQGEIILFIENAISSVTGDSESTIRLGVDGLGTIYALGTSAESIFVFTPEGKYVTRFGSEGEDKDQFTSTYAIAVDNQSRVYVSDFGGLQVFAGDGRYLYKIPMPAYVYGLSFTDENQLLTVSSDYKVRVWDIK
jgi:ribosomal protein L7/L12